MSDPVRWSLGFVHDESSSFVVLFSGDSVRDLRADAAAFPGVELDCVDGTRQLLQQWEVNALTLSQLAAESGGRWLPLSSVHVDAPLLPRQILQAGANYRKHVIDLAIAHADIANGRSEDQVRAETAEMMDLRKREGIPYFFIGLPSAVTGPYDEVTLPSYSDRHDWELELAVVIGRRAFHVHPDHALDHVAAYTIVNDLTTRDLVFRRDMPEIGTDWFRSKNAPGFLPLGPWLVPAEQVPDPQKLHLTLRLNDGVMQDESAEDMLFSVAELIAAASETLPLEPGDVLLTGSPAGNGAHWGRMLRDGDVMESTITGLGTQRTPVVAEKQK